MNQLILKNANLLDGENPAQQNMTVVVNDGRIVEVCRSSESPVSENGHVVDLGGLTLMPGMVSGHFHAAYKNLGGEEQSPASRWVNPAVSQSYIGLVNCQAALSNGYTSVVGAGTPYNIDIELSDAIEAGEVIGPRLIPCSRTFIPVEEGHGQPETEHGCPCEGPDDFRSGVLRDIEGGAKVLKIYATGSHGAELTRDMTSAEIEAVVEAAHSNGARVRAHVAGRDAVLQCVRLGVDIIDHADGSDDECIEAFIEHDSFVLPSLYMPLRAVELGGFSFGFTDLEDFEYMCGVLPKMAAAGVKLVTGDDFGAWQIPHGSYSEELQCYVEHSDVTPLEVIKWATKYGGEMTGIEDLGTIEKGKLADLLIVDGDPSEDIKVLTDKSRILTVIKDGNVVSGSLPDQVAKSRAVSA